MCDSSEKAEEESGFQPGADDLRARARNDAERRKRDQDELEGRIIEGGHFNESGQLPEQENVPDASADRDVYPDDVLEDNDEVLLSRFKSCAAREGFAPAQLLDVLEGKHQGWNFKLENTDAYSIYVRLRFDPEDDASIGKLSGSEQTTSWLASLVETAIRRSALGVKFSKASRSRYSLQERADYNVALPISTIRKIDRIAANNGLKRATAIYQIILHEIKSLSLKNEPISDCDIT